MNTDPVMNNNTVFPMRETVVNPLSINAASSRYNLNFGNQVSGIITPTAAGTYFVKSMDGGNVVLPKNSYILAAGIMGTSGITGGTDCKIGTAVIGPSGPTGVIDKEIVPATPIASLITGSMPDPSTYSLGNTGPVPVLATTTGVYTSGVIKTTIQYANME